MKCHGLRRLVVHLLCIATIFLVLSGSALAKFRFVVMGDSRGPSQADPLNKREIIKIVDAIGKLKPKPDFVIFLADMAYIGGEYEWDVFNLSGWNGMMYPLTVNPNPKNPKEIKLYVNIGNHELYDGHMEKYIVKDKTTGKPKIDKTTGKPITKDRKRCVFSNQQNFLKFYKDINKDFVPQDGPFGTYLDPNNKYYGKDYDYRGLAYSFTFGDGAEKSFFAILDSFYLIKEMEKDRDYWYQKVLYEQREWVADKLEENKNTPFAFVMSHMPVYPASTKMERNNTLDWLWMILDDHKISAYFGAHDHCFDWCFVDQSVIPQFIPGHWKNTILHIITGRAGAWDYPGSKKPPKTGSAASPTTEGPASDASGTVKEAVELASDDPGDVEEAVELASDDPGDVEEAVGLASDAPKKDIHRPEHHPMNNVYNFIVVDVDGEIATIQPYGRKMGDYDDKNPHFKATGNYEPLLDKDKNEIKFMIPARN